MRDATLLIPIAKFEHNKIRVLESTDRKFRVSKSLGAFMGGGGGWDYEVFAYDEMDVDELPNCVVNGDIATFKFFTEKPELLYTVGSCLKAHPHTPQPPDNSNFPGYEFDYNPKSEKNTMRPFQRCLLHPPWPGKTEAGEVEFKIVNWVQAGDPNDAQVVAIRILNTTVDLPTDINILAMIPSISIISRT
ncbi:hypothetical protein V500_01537 [Pseudogymnoascus sp. VKM F-4518 (FW-2643)]|nr:hypothetical protein V500_01537 [Pseudogymnoascus sp. VKM F-4518 (FW-2643)]